MEERPWYQYYDPGVILSPSYPKTPLTKQFIEWVNKHPDQPYIYYLDMIITYKQANILACKLANAMMKVGIKKGDRVAVTLPNMPEFVIAVHACLKVGAIIVLTNPRYSKRELNYQYTNSGAETVICLEQNADTNIEILQDRHNSLKRIIVISKSDSNIKLCNNDNTISYDEFINYGQAGEPEINISLDDLALLIYTGGTTGVSKGCCITNANLIAVASGWVQMCQSFTDVNNYKVLCATPLYHIYGFQTAINANILLGGSMVIIPEITIDNIITAINKHELNVWPAVPVQISGLARHPNTGKSKANKIQYIACGSSPLPITAIREFENIVKVPILEGFGASETSMAVASNPIRKRKVGSVGIPYPNVDFKVVDIKTGNMELPIGDIGELCFKGPQVVKEYWKNPEETALTFKDGWWYSGDIGYMDEDGYIFLVDRKKDMIISSGFNVYTKEIDEILNNHPKILEAGVIGVPDAKRGETAKAYVVIKRGEILSEDEIKSFCRQYLAAYKVPTQVEFIDILPRTSVQKLDRKALRLFEEGKKLYIVEEYLYMQAVKQFLQI